MDYQITKSLMFSHDFKQTLSISTRNHRFHVVQKLCEGSLFAKVTSLDLSNL